MPRPKFLAGAPHAPSERERELRKSLGMQISADLGDARLEAEPTLDVKAGHWHGALTLRHPGAWRFINAAGIGQALGLNGPAEWLGEGSLSLVAQMSGEPGRVSADSFDLTAGELHSGGTLTLALADHAPQLVGKLTAETLPLPAFDAHSDEPLPMEALRGWQASLQIFARRVLSGFVPVADDASADVSLEAGVLHVQRLRAGLGGGEITGEGMLDSAATPPSVTMHAGWSGLALAAGGLPLAPSGRADGTADLAATGYSPATWVATVRGSVGLHVSDGTLAGVDLPAIRASMSQGDEHADAATLQTEVEQAVRQGSTPFSTFDATGRLGEGDLKLSNLRLAAASGGIMGSGDASLTRGTVDLQLRLLPDLPDAPQIGLRLFGPFAAPASHPDLVGLAAWLGERAAAPAVSPH